MSGLVSVENRNRVTEDVRKYSTHDLIRAGMELELATPIGKSRSDIEQIATTKIKEWGYQVGNDLKPIVEGKLGGRVIELDSDEWMETQEASVCVFGERNFAIFLGEFLGTHRMRFSIAHELGHYVLHSNEGRRKIRANRSGKTAEEREANQFAAAFLMPETEFKEEYKRVNGRIYSLAGKFRVSPEAIDYRAKNLFK